jgi:hypothetical protein
MAARMKKSTSSPRGAGKGQSAVRAVIERQRASRKFVEFAERIARSEHEAVNVTRRAGIVTGTGRLTKPYKS